MYDIKCCTIYAPVFSLCQLQQRIEQLDANNIELIKLMQNVRGIWDIMNGKDGINGRSEKWNELNGYLRGYIIHSIQLALKTAGLY